MANMISLDDDGDEEPIWKIPMEYVSSPFVPCLFDFEIINMLSSNNER